MYWVTASKINLSVPPGFPSDCEVIIEPNLAQTREFFTLMSSSLKNCQAVSIIMTTEAKKAHYVYTHLPFFPG
jgi:hypothetical protein